MKYKSYIDIIIDITHDIRKLLIYLETLTNIKKISKNKVYELFGILNETILNKKLKKIKNVTDIEKNIYDFNYTIDEIINEFLNLVLKLKCDKQKKYNFIIFLSEIDHFKNKNMNFKIIIMKILNEYLKLK